MHVIGYCDVGAGDFLKTTCGGDYVSRPESGFLQTLFFQNKLLHEIQLQKTSKLNRFLFYSHKISHNGRTVSTYLSRVGESTNCF